MNSNDISPKSEHLKIVKYACLLVGEWPFTSQDHPVLRKLYRTYALFTLTYFITFAITSLIQFILLLIDEIVVVEEVLSNLTVTLYYLITVSRVFVFKTARAKAFIGEIIIWETRIIKGNDKELVQIYRSYAKLCRMFNTIFFYSIYIAGVMHFVYPLFLDDTVRFYESRNETVVLRPLPLSSWFPVNVNKYYVTCYILQVVYGSMGGNYVLYTDLYTQSLIIFAVGQINVLRHILSNLDDYFAKVKRQINCEEEEARFITLRECILKHKHIIGYIDEFNNTMSGLMLLDFLQSSLQLASVTLRMVVMENVPVFNSILSLEFAVSMVIRLLMYYWFANEIVVQSAEISQIINTGKWYEQPLKLQKMMLMMMMRCNRQLSLKVGPFTTMTLSTFLGILKATYSYVMIFYK